jgi:ATP-dependent Lhr-like helicase
VDLMALLQEVENPGQSKWDWALPRELLVRSFASMHLDLAGAKAIAARMVSGL